MSVSLWPTLPKDNESNGLTALERPLMEDPEGPYYLIAEVNRRRYTGDDDTGDVTPKIRFLHGEAALGEHSLVVRELLREIQIERCGPPPPPPAKPATLEFPDDQGDELAGRALDEAFTGDGHDNDGPPLPGEVVDADEPEPAAGRPTFLAPLADNPDIDGE